MLEQRHKERGEAARALAHAAKALGDADVRATAELRLCLITLALGAPRVAQEHLDSAAALGAPSGPGPPSSIWHARPRCWPPVTSSPRWSRHWCSTASPCPAGRRRAGHPVDQHGRAAGPPGAGLRLRGQGGRGEPPVRRRPGHPGPGPRDRRARGRRARPGPQPASSSRSSTGTWAGPTTPRRTGRSRSSCTNARGTRWARPAVRCIRRRRLSGGNATVRPPGSSARPCPGFPRRA